MAREPQPNPWRLAGVGMELAAGPLAGALIGYWIDQWQGTEPWGITIGALTGLASGMYLFVKEILRIMRENQRR